MAIVEIGTSFGAAMTANSPWPAPGLLAPHRAQIAVGELRTPRARHARPTRDEQFRERRRRRAAGIRRDELLRIPLLTFRKTLDRGRSKRQRCRVEGQRIEQRDGLPAEAQVFAHISHHDEARRAVRHDLQSFAGALSRVPSISPVRPAKIGCARPAAKIASHATSLAPSLLGTRTWTTRLPCPIANRLDDHVCLGRKLRRLERDWHAISIRVDGWNAEVDGDIERGQSAAGSNRDMRIGQGTWTGEEESAATRTTAVRNIGLGR